MFNSSNAPFTMPVQPASNGGFGFGGNGFDSIIALAILAMIFGWGNGGWGGYGNGQSTSVYEGYVLNNDFSQLSSLINSGFSEQRGQGIQLANGISSLGYEQLGLMNGINTNIMQTGNAIQTQIADCCCKTQTAVADVNYNIATQANGITSAVNTGFCQTNFNNQNNTRDIIDSQNNGTRAILDKLCQMENNAKDERIAELTAKNADLRLASSQQAQNAYLIDKLGYKMPVPAYQVPNPYCSCGQNLYGTTIA